jgi:hypothetical protein
MGYAALDQSARGIHTRLFSRAFVFESDGTLVVYVSADLGMVDQAIKTQVGNGYCMIFFRAVWTKRLFENVQRSEYFETKNSKIRAGENTFSLIIWYT